MSCLAYFDPDCQQCPRLAEFLTEVRSSHPDYHARPVSPFGTADARLLVVGLAPGMHGANATGRPFTGDYAGLLLYDALFHFGFSNQPNAIHANDGLVLNNCRITNAVKCLPPQNKPTGNEIKQCNPFLAKELATLPDSSVILVLGNIAHQAVLKAFGYKSREIPFGHNQVCKLANGHTLVSSYHSSRYNVQTRRLTKEMFFDVFKNIEQLL
jgi:uracil-DNA glycosylase